MKTKLTIGLLFTLLATASFADSYAKCKGCHGVNGEKKALGKSKIIKDMTKAEIKASLLGYQAGTYGGAMKGLMKGQVKSLTVADIDAISNQIGK